ncbi:MAG: hypothetical protein LBL86_11395, partial [Coriobacteriales bacterium]|nr:hypothetical protein [Coriobacteriales bacterium]
MPITDRALKRARKGLLFAGLSLLLFNLYFMLTGHSSAYALPTSVQVDVPIERLAFLLSRTGCCLVIAVFDRFFRRANVVLLPTITVLTILGNSLLSLAAHQTLVPMHMLASGGGIVAGFGYAWFLLSIFRLFRKNGSMWHIAVLFVISYALSNFAKSVIHALAPPQWLPLIVLLLILIMGISLFLAQRLLGVDEAPRLPPMKRGLDITKQLLKSSEAMRAQVILLLASSLALVIMAMTNPGGLWGNARFEDNIAYPVPLTLIEVIGYACIALPLYYFHTHKTSGFWAQAPAIFTFAGLFLLEYLQVGNADTSIALALSAIVELLTWLTYSICITSCMRVFPLSSVRVVGVIATINFTLQLLSMLFVEGNLPTISICVLVVGASYLLALLASLKAQDTPRMGGGGGGAGKPGKLSRVATDLNTRIEVIAHNDNFTQRETEKHHL